MLTLPTRIPRTNRPRWTPLDPMRHQPDKAAPTATPVTADYHQLTPSALSQPLHRLQRPSSPPPRLQALPTLDRTTSDVSSPSTITTRTLTSSDVDSVPTCSLCDRTFTSHIGLVGHSRIHRLEHQSTFAAPDSTALTPLMGLLDHMRIHENLR
nr:unnamed protein product [Spirometra erinaceieuropaei]